jgi:hypothetical protein
LLDARVIAGRVSSAISAQISFQYLAREIAVAWKARNRLAVSRPKDLVLAVGHEEADS